MIHRSIPVARVALFLRYASFAESLGAPVEHLLACCAIPAELLDHPSAAVGLKGAFKFMEMACEASGTEHIGLYLGMQASLEDLGPAGEQLKRSTTVYDYLRQGIATYDTLITGQRVWLSPHGEEIRLNIATMLRPGVGPYQSHMETLSMTVMALRRALGKDWAPQEIGLAQQSREDLPKNSCFERSRIVRAAEASYMVIPRTALEKTFPVVGPHLEQVRESVDKHRFSGELSDLVQLQIEAMLCEENLHIDIVAESLMLSRRSLQRTLAEQGTSYSNLLADTRLHQAQNRLRCSDEPVAEIAFSLGYSEASNFTRAFRLKNGVSPQKFRQNLNSI